MSDIHDSKLSIGALEEGFVLDHIKAGNAMTIYRDLKLGNLDCTVAIIKNASSNKMGRKDIIKIDADMNVNLDVIGYVDPGATANIIRDGVLVEKRTIGQPELLTDVIRCKNPRCITSTEQELKHIFRRSGSKDRAVYRCIYCETKAE